MSEFVDKVAAEIADKDDRQISPLFDDLDELRDQYRNMSRAAITATLNHLADKWQGAEAYIVVENWHETETHDLSIADWLRHQAEELVK